MLKKIRYNSPVILTFTLISAFVFLSDALFSLHLTERFFLYRGGSSPLDILKMFTCTLGHGSYEHLMGNLTVMLLIGPMIEEKYGSLTLAVLMIVTALVTGLAYMFFFSGGILGASGIVFTLIMLTSFTNSEEGIPLTFILVVIIFLGKEFYNGLFIKNNISELAHILGAFVGIAYRFLWKPRRTLK